MKNGSTSQLQLQVTSGLYGFLPLNRLYQLRAVVERTHRVEDLRHPVIGKHGNLVNVAELPVALASEARPHVRDENLGALEEADGTLAALEGELVAEAGEVTREDVDEARGGALGRPHEVFYATVIFLDRRVSARVVIVVMKGGWVRIYACRGG